MTSANTRYEPVAFTALNHWAGDDHLAAFQAFVRSCTRLATLNRQTTTSVDVTSAPAQALTGLCAVTLASAPATKTAETARAFFETYFTPHRVVHDGPAGLLTGYYEPLIKGARSASAAFPVPIYKRPPDLINLVGEAQRGAAGVTFTHARKTATGSEPYATRAEIEAGALQGRNLELLYLPDPVEVFFLQVQGSGQIQLPDGQRIRISYDGKNGHPYTSVGRALIEQGAIDAARMSLQALGDWLRADPVRGRGIMQLNKSYVFFRELTGREADAALGVLDIPLTVGRSLAIDVSYHALGLPIYVSSPTLVHATASGGFHRLMIAQDVGSAIKGPERGDLYFGSGDPAGKIAGVTKHAGTFHVLLPRAATGSLPAAVKSPPGKSAP